ncbi:MAG TPA: DNA ligase D [Bryobacteraceae bacterium]|jgi:bifunctional non-homologous end joining protein LigD|nr:DNA ligase D [Bryobacteraceae bacterium]
MPLEEYAAKRRFEKTPEPAPSAGKSKFPPHYFCVQRHDATRLHYDFRLEIDGVLKSWAVPKGPTLDPALKHFAAHVEDHPIDYGDFEGNIPKGNYGGGSVMLWDRGTFTLLGDVSGVEQIARGDLKFQLHGEKLNGDFALVHMKGRGKGNEWLILKKRDQFAVPGWEVEAHAYSVLSGRTQAEIASNLPARQTKQKTAGDTERVWATSPPAKRAAKAAPAPAPAAPPRAKKKTKLDLAAVKGARKAEMPAAIDPMLATLTEKAPRGEDWLFEIKWDGIRAIVSLEREEVRISSRNGIRCERQYPELAVLPHQVAGQSAILDGEIAVLDELGVSRFHLIQPRISNTDPNSIAHLSRSTPVVLFAFDLLYLDGYDLRGVELAKRRELLQTVIAPGGVLRISEVFPGAGEELLEAARGIGLEGVVAKHGSSLYESRRSREWLKIKIVGEQEFVIGGFTAPQGDRDYFGALVLGVQDEGELRWVGNVGTGFDQKLLASLFAKLKPLIVDKCPFETRPKPDKGMTWVKPELVCQVKFANWTTDRRLRAPVFLGLRNDVAASGVVREEPASEERKPLLADGKEASLRIDGQALKFTNLKKVFYPDEGFTKRDVLNYYDGVADLILPHLKDRPLSLKRYPNGIKEDYFFQKNAADSFASWLRTERIDDIEYVFAGDRASLLYLVNLGCIDQNPWMSRSPSLDNPDFILIDLDPQECVFDKIVDAALLVKTVLDRIGLTGYPKTTGGDGMHVYVPVEPVYSYEETRTFADLISRLTIAENPGLFTTPRTVAKRQKNRVYFDYLQNGRSKTIAAPYVLRAYAGAPVATPLEWSEVQHGLHPTQFNITNALDRFAERGDLFAGVLNAPQTLDDALLKVEKLMR